jgi:hypothetical protein
MEDYCIYCFGKIGYHEPYVVYEHQLYHRECFELLFPDEGIMYYGLTG